MILLVHYLLGDPFCLVDEHERGVLVECRSSANAVSAVLEALGHGNVAHPVVCVTGGNSHSEFALALDLSADLSKGLAGKADECNVAESEARESYVSVLRVLVDRGDMHVDLLEEDLVTLDRLCVGVDREHARCDHATDVAAVLVALLRAVAKVNVAAVALRAVEECDHTALAVCLVCERLLKGLSYEMNVVGRELVAALCIGMACEVYDRDIVSALANYLDELYRLVGLTV